ncbi:MAG: MFS transporter [Pseudolabrys sp.]|nr:MFS transporter [Pseudolabrys sp.]
MTSSRKTIAVAAALILTAGFLVLFITGGARFAVGLTLKPIVDDLGWGRSELGLAVAIYQVLSAGAMFAAGFLVDRSGPKLVLIGGLIVSGIGIGLMSVMTSPWHALVLYGVIFGLGSGAASLIPVSVMVTRAFPYRTGIANAVVISGMSAGQLVMIAGLAALLLTVNWRSIYVLLGIAHLILVPLLMFAIPKTTSAQSKAARPSDGLGIAEAAQTRQFWLLLAVYAICGLDDFFVVTHVVAFAQDRGADAFLAGNLLALMGLTGLLGLLATGAFSDRSGPVWPTAIAFIARVAVFALIMVDQSTLSVAIFALVFGITLMVTAPLTAIFVSQYFGTRHLGALTGLITMVHHVFGGFGAYLGAAVFDSTGTYNIAFVVMFASSVLAVALCAMLRKPAARPIAP